MEGVCPACGKLWMLHTPGCPADTQTPRVGNEPDDIDDYMDWHDSYVNEVAGEQHR